MNLVCVPPAQAGTLLPFVSARIVGATRKAGMGDADKIAADVLAGHALLWLAIEGTEVHGAGVTEIVERSGRRLCDITTWSCDDQASCAHLIERIERYARDEQCEAVRVVGRMGWARALKDYEAKAVILEKAV